MRPNRSLKLFVAAVLACLMLVLTHTWARQQSAFDQIDLLLDVRHELLERYVEKPDQQALIRSAIDGMIGALGDPHTSYLSEDQLQQFDAQVRGEFAGIGAEVDMHEGRLRIVTPLEDSPAWEAGVMAGDIVLEVDGESTAGMDLNDAVERLRGEAGTDVTIRVLRGDSEEQEITITRDNIQIETVRGYRRDGDNRHDFLIEKDRPIGYVRLTQFNERTTGEMRQVLERLNGQEIQGLILDMRFNPGGLLESAIAVSDMFLPAGATIASVEGRSVPEESFEAASAPLLDESTPIVVLINEASASGAEIVAGALSDNSRAFVVGQRSFGKGSVQTVRRLMSGQGALKLTNAYYAIPSGRVIHRRDEAEVWGVDPSEGGYVNMNQDQIMRMLERRRERDLEDEDGNDVLYSPTPDQVEEYLADPQLAAALRAMLGWLEDGDWPVVGEEQVEAFVEADQREQLVAERERLSERLREINEQLGDMPAMEEEPVD